MQLAGETSPGTVTRTALLEDQSWFIVRNSAVRVRMWCHVLSKNGDRRNHPCEEMSSHPESTFYIWETLLDKATGSLVKTLWKGRKTLMDRGRFRLDQEQAPQRRIEAGSIWNQFQQNISYDLEINCMLHPYGRFRWILHDWRVQFWFTFWYFFKLWFYPMHGSGSEPCNWCVKHFWHPLRQGLIVSCCSSPGWGCSGGGLAKEVACGVS